MRAPGGGAAVEPSWANGFAEVVSVGIRRSDLLAYPAVWFSFLEKYLPTGFAADIFTPTTEGEDAEFVGGRDAMFFSTASFPI